MKSAFLCFFYLLLNAFSIQCGVYEHNSNTSRTTQHNKEIGLLREEVAVLNEQLAWFKRQLFGQKAEKFVDNKNEDQLCFEGFDKLIPVAPEKKNYSRPRTMS